MRSLWSGHVRWRLRIGVTACFWTKMILFVMRAIGVAFLEGSGGFRFGHVYCGMWIAGFGWRVEGSSYYVCWRISGRAIRIYYADNCQREQDTKAGKKLMMAKGRDDGEFWKKS